MDKKNKNKINDLKKKEIRLFVIVLTKFKYINQLLN